MYAQGDGYVIYDLGTGIRMQSVGTKPDPGDGRPSHGYNLGGQACWLLILRVAYISEPLNVLHRPGTFRARVANWYTYICDDNAAEYAPAFAELISYRYHLLAEVASLRTFHDVARMGRDLSVFVSGRLRHSIPLLKDPFAAFSVPWFARSFKCRVVVTIRHPAAFAGGLKRLNWYFDFQDLLRQPLLMRDHLGRFREAMGSSDPGDIVGQAGLLWSMIYSTLGQFRSDNPGILVVRHEDLAQDPLEGFRDLVPPTSARIYPWCPSAQFLNPAKWGTLLSCHVGARMQ